MGSKINAGELRHQVTWQTNTPAATPTSGGQELPNWSTVGVHFAKVEPLTGRELWNAKQIKATSTIKVTMRNVGAILPSDRLLLDATGRIFEIDSVILTFEVDFDLVLACTELKSPQ
jgi:head-tail adaptor